MVDGKSVDGYCSDESGDARALRKVEEGLKGKWGMIDSMGVKM